MNKSAQETGISGIEIIKIIGLSLILIFLLNYLNIFPLSGMFPGAFGFLPHLSAEKPVTSSQTTNSSISLPCPLPGKSCEINKSFITKKLPTPMIGYFNAMNNDPVAAIIDGQITEQIFSYKSVKLSTLSIRNVQENLEITYIFTGDHFLIPNGKNVKKGEVLAYLSSIPLPKQDLFENYYNLVLNFKNITKETFFNPSSSPDGKIINLSK